MSAHQRKLVDPRLLNLIHIMSEAPETTALPAETTEVPASSDVQEEAASEHPIAADTSATRQPPRGPPTGFMLYIPSVVMSAAWPWDPESGNVGPMQMPSDDLRPYVANKASQTDDVGLPPLECLEPWPRDEKTWSHGMNEDDGDGKWLSHGWDWSSWTWKSWDDDSPHPEGWWQKDGPNEGSTWDEACAQQQKRMIPAGGIMINEPPPAVKRSRQDYDQDS